MPYILSGCGSCLACDVNNGTKLGRAKNSRNLSFKSKKEYVQVVRVPSTSLRGAWHSGQLGSSSSAPCSSKRWHPFAQISTERSFKVFINSLKNLLACCAVPGKLWSPSWRNGCTRARSSFIPWSVVLLRRAQRSNSRTRICADFLASSLSFSSLISVNERASNNTTHKNAHCWGCGCGLLAVTIGYNTRQSSYNHKTDFPWSYLLVGAVLGCCYGSCFNRAWDVRYSPPIRFSMNGKILL